MTEQRRDKNRESFNDYHELHHEVKIKNLAEDIKYNGLFFTRDMHLLEELQEADSRIKYKWNKEDQLYDVWYDRNS